MNSRHAENLSLFEEYDQQTIDNNKLTKAEPDARAVAYWNKCLEIIRDNIDEQAYKTWFQPVKALSWQNNQLTILVPSQFFFEWIEEHFYGLLQKTIVQVLGEDAKLQYQVVVDDSEDSLQNRTIKLPGFRYRRASSSGGSQNELPFSQPQEAPKTELANFLNPRYSFDNFIIGESNQLARSAAMAVSQSPGGTKFNPLVIYGDTGLGKTHLAQAIGNYIAQNEANAKVLYTNSERFTMEFVNAIQNNKLNEFMNFYHSIDVLIVDDIQFFRGKEKTQDNFFHTFNALHQNGKQLVLTSDKPPRELKQVDERLISRFQWGLTVDIQHPDLEMRMAILKKKSMDEGLDLPEDTVEYLAQHVKSSIRELEGILISLIAKVTLDKRELDLDLAKEVVKGVIPQDEKPLYIDDIKEYVAKYYNLTRENLESKTRKHEIALARQMAMYLAKQLTELSLKSIGKSFGGRDHSTVLHSCATIENYLNKNNAVKKAYESLFSKLKKKAV